MGLKDFFTRKKKSKRKYKIGLCLSGGGARGFSFIGAFRAFQENGIEFDAVAGTSAGSLFGSLYASKMSYDDMMARVKNVKNSDFRKSKLGFLPSSMDKLRDTLSQVLSIKKIEELPIPYFAVAVDLRTGQEIHFDSGDLATVIAGSCAIPGVFLPVRYKNMTLIDGGVSNNIPADVLKMNGCDFVVTIDCNCTRGGGTNSTNFFTQFSTSIGIMMVNNSKKGLKASDLIICPDLKKYNSLKVAGKEEMIEEGYRATMENMSQIKKLFAGELFKR
ncbi:MAG: hypothetical protein E7351_03710 [Clostridiales bacterium]|nr:hypothetical protein [Clostridiales bacterium]